MVFSSDSVDILASAQNNLSDFSKNLLTHIIPVVSHGAASLKSDKYISYNLRLSAQYSSTISSGFTTFLSDLDILATTFSSFSHVSVSTISQSFSSIKSFAINLPFLS
ncbi:hypothetical protein HOF65_06475 [bacterium]|jgi:hypothetical protein|nr:hypothetical protein [bacterium]MBT3853573.1 hypothetical protein [bacterium]MBT4633585.1 hypothetical protein [bacterium]MBT6779138.1 hypothetical protein [bacterium]